jgi:hypothetical protein
MEYQPNGVQWGIDPFSHDREVQMLVGGYPEAQQL